MKLFIFWRKFWHLKSCHIRKLFSEAGFIITKRGFCRFLIIWIVNFWLKVSWLFCIYLELTHITIIMHIQWHFNILVRFKPLTSDLWDYGSLYFNLISFFNSVKNIHIFDLGVILQCLISNCLTFFECIWRIYLWTWCCSKIEFVKKSLLWLILLISWRSSHFINWFFRSLLWKHVTIAGIVILVPNKTHGLSLSMLLS